MTAEKKQQAGELMKTYVLPIILPLVVFVFAFGGERALDKEKVDSLSREQDSIKLEMKETRLEVKDNKNQIILLNGKLEKFISDSRHEQEMRDTVNSHRHKELLNKIGK